MIRARRPLLALAGVCLAWTMVLPADAAVTSAADSLTWTTLVDDLSDGYARGDVSLVFDSRRGHVIAFGGWNTYSCSAQFHADVYYPDVRVLDLATSTGWASFPTSGIPFQKWGASAVYDSLDDRVLVFGGYPYDVDVKVLDLATSTWSSVTPVGPVPAARRNASMTIDPIRRRALLYGGVDSDGVFRNDVWALSLDDPGTWSRIQPSGGLPEGRARHLAAFDVSRDRLVVTCGSTLLADTETWELAFAGGAQWNLLGRAPGSPGPRIGGIDVRRDRLIAIAPNGRVDGMDLATNVWAAGSPEGFSPIDYGSLRDAAAVPDPTHDAIVTAWGGPHVFDDCQIINEKGPTHVLRFGALPLVHVTATFDSLAFSFGHIRGVWSLQFDRAPWAPVRFETDRFGSFESWGQVPLNASGIFHSDEETGPAPPFHNRLRWFDGQQFQTTPEVPIVSPQPPVNVNVVLESSSFSGDEVRGVFHLESDSLWFLTRTTLEYRVDGGAWTLDRSVYPDLDGRFGFVYSPLARNSTIEYRFRWDALPPAGAPVFPFTAPVVAVAVFDSSHVGATSLSIHWHADPLSAPLSGFVRKTGPGGGAWIDSIDVRSDPQGRLVFVDTGLQPGTFYSYELFLVDAAGTRRATEIGLYTLGGGGSGGGGFLSMTTPYPNPAGSDFTTTVAVPPGAQATVNLYDVAGRRRWFETLDAGVHVMRVNVASLDRGIYTFVVRRGREADSRRIAVIR